MTIPVIAQPQINTKNDQPIHPCIVTSTKGVYEPAIIR